MNTPDIVLTDEECVLLEKIEFDTDRFSYDQHKSNGEFAAALTKSLLARNAIPSHRMKYFSDREYYTGRHKASHKEIFYRNGRSDEEIIRHVHFLPFLYFFVCGPRLPVSMLERFRERVEKCGGVTSGDVLVLAKFARTELRNSSLSAHEAAEEYFKAALDCGIWVSYARAIRDYVNSTKIR